MLGLVLTGGGARAAYQAGVLRGISEISKAERCPFGVLTGVSAGAINSVALAAECDREFRAATEKLWSTWEHLQVHDVFRTDPVSLLGLGGRWIRDLGLGGFFGNTKSSFLLDTQPLRELLASRVDVAKVRQHIEAGRLRGVAVSATNYYSGTAVTFFDAHPEVAPWYRTTRIAKRTRLELDHVLASSAIPIFFPPVRVAGSHFGGRLHPAHGASQPGDPPRRRSHPRDRDPLLPLAGDDAQAQRDGLPGRARAREHRGRAPERGLPRLARGGPRAARADQPHRAAPRARGKGGAPRPAARDPDPRDQALARPGLARVGAVPALPRALRHLLKGLGASDDTGWDLLSYLAFDTAYTTRLLELGYEDALKQKSEIEAFLKADVPATAPRSEIVAQSDGLGTASSTSGLTGSK